VLASVFDLINVDRMILPTPSLLRNCALLRTKREDGRDMLLVCSYPHELRSRGYLNLSFSHLIPLTLGELQRGILAVKLGRC
jgi:hypothetical protein